MANLLRPRLGLQIYVDDDSENQDPRNAGKRMDNGQGEPAKRLPLATISNLRVQPTRAAKQTTSTYAAVTAQVPKPFGAIPKTKDIPQQQAFHIHKDDNELIPLPLPLRDLKQENVENSENNCSVVMDEASPIKECITISDSPMVMDLSFEKKPSHRSKYAKDSLFMRDYSKEIHEFMLETEKKFRPRANYMRKQPDITSSMRSILVDWLVEVAEEYKLHADTLFLAASYIDRFLSSMSVLRSKLQLVGTACMFIASKYEEVYPPDVSEFVYITDDTYTKKQVLRMEQLVLKVLSFDLNVPTAYHFLQYYCELLDLPQQVEYLAQFLCELTLLEAEPYLKFLPSMISLSAICLANFTLNREAWTEALAETTGYGINDLKEVIDCLYTSFCNAHTYPQQAIVEKYKSDKFQSVSSISPPSVKPY